MVRVVSDRMKFAVRVVVTLVIFVLIFRGIDIRQVARVAAGADPGLLAAAILLIFLGTSLAAYRWSLIMNNLGLERSAAAYWQIYLKGMFFNQGLPTSVGGDAIRVLDAAGRRYSKLEALYGVMLDRIAGVTALLTLNLLAYAAAPEMLPEWVRYVVFALAVGLVAAFVAGLNLRHFRWLDRWPRLTVLRTLSERFHQAFSKRRTALVVSSLVVHVFAILCVWAIGRSLGLSVDVLTYFILVPPAMLFTVIPISLAGWGVREGAMVALFSFVGADKERVLAMSILYGLILIIVSLVGLVLFLRGRRPSADAPRPD
jgi:uncharacterized membrane protein YbhN (UPF0104 family)